MPVTRRRAQRKSIHDSDDEEDEDVSAHDASDDEEDEDVSAHDDSDDDEDEDISAHDGSDDDEDKDVSANDDSDEVDDYKSKSVRNKGGNEKNKQTGRKPAVKRQITTKKISKVISTKKGKNNGLDEEDASNDEHNSNDDDDIPSNDDSKDEDFEENETSSNDDEESIEESEEEDDYSPSRRSGRVAKALRMRSEKTFSSRNKRQIKSQLFDNDTNSDQESLSNESESSDSGTRIASKASRGVIRSTRNKAHSENGRNRNNLGYTNKDRLTTRRRTSAVKSANQISYKEASDNDEDETFPLSNSSKRRSKKFIEDDEDFVLDENNENLQQDEYEEEEDFLESDDESLVGAADDGSEDSNSRVGIVREQDVGDAYSDESEEEVVKTAAAHRNHNAKTSTTFTSDDSSHDSLPQKGRNYPYSSPSMPNCNSTLDAITLEVLPTKHICFLTPDNKSRQCFCLSTLRKIALATAHPMFRNDLTGGKQTFLQPPHFRTPMSDDLLDQISSRFGRDAVDLHSSFYKRKFVEDDEESENDDNEEYFDTNDSLTGSSAFIEQVQSYIRSTMGSQDIYACPLCYVVAHKNLQCSFTKGKKRNIGEKYPTEFSFDPMMILGHEDNDAFEIASAFCFTKVSELKYHIRNDHQVDTRIVKGNDLYARFKIRETDGLLQRYISDQSTNGTSRHGMMVRYWFEGNNYSFLLLLSQIHQATVFRDVLSEQDLDDDETLDKANKYMQPALDFFDTFANEASSIWDIISQPFTKESKEEIDEFIADDDEESAGSVGDYQEFNMQAALREQEETRKVAAHYEHINKNDSIDNDEMDGSDIIDNTELVFDDSSDEEDEWEQHIADKLQAKIDSSRKRPGNGFALQNLSPTKRLSKSRESSNSPLNLNEGFDNDKPTSKTQGFLEDSDDETPQLTGSSHSFKSHVQSQSSIPSSAIRKRLVIRESDDDIDE